MKKPIVLDILLVAAVILVSSAPAHAQTAQAAPPPVKKPAAAQPTAAAPAKPPAAPAVATQGAAPGITQEQASAILLELRQIRMLLEKQVAQTAAAQPQPPGPPERARVTLGDSLAQGSPDAPVTMIEFTDLQCSFCKRFHDTTFAEIKKNFVDTGKVRFVHRDLPLDFHSQAMRAAVAARCANEQSKFWPMRDALISQATSLSPEVIANTARKLGLNMDAYQACVDSGKHKAAIERDLADAISLEVDGTPTFFIGKSAKDAIEGKRLVGAHPYVVFERAIQDALAAK